MHVGRMQNTNFMLLQQLKIESQMIIFHARLLISVFTHIRIDAVGHEKSNIFCQFFTWFSVHP